jgi:glycosyltransferase involved in cell wall biosynthesis
MRVVHLSCIAPPQTGGMGRTPAGDVSLLLARGISATQIAPASAEVSTVPNVLRLPATWTFGNAGRIKPKELEAALEGADVVHLHYPFYGTAGMVAKLRRKGVIKRLVMTLHMDATADGPKGIVFAVHRLLFQKKILASADRLIASSLDYVRASSFAPFTDRVVELPFGIDAQKFSPGPSERESFEIKSDSFALGFVGGMDTAHAFKGVDVLLSAISKVPSAQLFLVGDGDLRPSYEALAKYLQISDRVTFLGKMSEVQLISFYRSIDSLVLPSTSGAEAFGLVALEAQACGTPVIASDLPGVRTVVLHDYTGLLTPPSSVEGLVQAIQQMMEPERRARLASSTRSFVESKFTREQYGEKLVQIYTDVCASRS